jgi:hypothetical protein
MRAFLPLALFRETFGDGFLELGTGDDLRFD